MGKFFGTDGIRGVANRDLTCEVALNAGRACAGFFKNDDNSRLFIARDTRVSGTMLESAFAAGAMSMGCNVISGGILPTPGVSLLVRELNCTFGVVISASHNPVQDNGIKLFSKDGYKLTDSQELEIEKMMSADFENLPVGIEIGSFDFDGSAKKRYSDHIIKNISCDLSGLKIALDCACGASGDIAPDILKSMGAQVFSINTQLDGKRINVNCGSTNMDALRELTLNNKCDLGIAFDGDADRCLMIDENGNTVDGDKIIAMSSIYLKELGRLNNNNVVTTVMSNMGLEIALRDHGIELVRAGVGDRYVIEKMKEFGAVIGGEQSGHIILHDFNTTGDGPLTACFVAGILKNKKQRLSELASVVKQLPQVLINVKAKNKNALSSDEKIASEIEQCEKNFAGKGRVLVRPSGTESLIRVMIEGENKDAINEAAQKIANLIEERLN